MKKFFILLGLLLIFNTLAFGVTTSTFDIYGIASDGSTLTGSVTAWVNDIDLVYGTADVSFLIHNTSPSVPSVLPGNPLTNPVISGFFFKADGTVNASLTGVGNTLDLVTGSVSGDVYTAIRVDPVIISDYDVDYDKQAPGHGFFRVKLFDSGANDKGWVATGAQNLFVRDYIVGPMAFSLHLTNVTSIFDASSFAQVTNPNFVARYRSTGPDGEGSGTAIPIPEPSTLVLLGVGLIGLGSIARLRSKK